MAFGIRGLGGFYIMETDATVCEPLVQASNDYDKQLHNLQYFHVESTPSM